MNEMARRIIGERMKREREPHEHHTPHYEEHHAEHHSHADSYRHATGGLRLSSADLKLWKHMLKNGDGSTGGHFSKEHMREVMHQVGATFEGYDEAEMCMTANMLYSDMCEALRPLITPEKEAMVYAKMARAWLEDDDGPEGSEKLALYYYCIVDGED